MTGARAAALARRSASGSASRPGDDGAERVLALAASSAVLASMYASAFAMISSDRVSASSLVSPHAVMP